MKSSTAWRTVWTAAVAAVLCAAYASPAFADPPDRFEPPVVNATVQAGQSINVNKTLHLTGLPARADIIIAIDTTGSMDTAINQAKAEAIQICNDVKAAIPGARFAAVDFEDYPTQPLGSPADTPYLLLTPGYVADCATFAAAIGTMTPDGGGDGPESYNRVHFEAYSDGVLLASRDPQATQFLVELGDNFPHSNVAFGACPAAPPIDPGRDQIHGTADDLNTPTTIAGLNANDIILLMIAYNTGAAVLPCYESMAQATGGDAVPAGGAGTISAFIIAEAAEVPYTVSLAVNPGCQIGFSFSPAPPYGPFQGPSHPTFTETITAPTAAGNYTCTITAVMSPGGPTTAVQTVNLTVVAGPPATITLTPPTDVNIAGEEHCVTATVRDQFGNPVPGTTINFTVSGANTRTGVGVTNANGQAVFCYTGTVAGTDTITATAVGGSNPTATATKVYRAGPPATLVLTPETATNVVDDEHCVTATVRDAFGNPVPNAPVDFTVTGSTTTGGTVTTGADGTAEFCYIGPALPGADLIRATAQGGTRPTDTATKTWVIPASTEGCKITYGGRITAANGDKATFGGNAKAPDKGQEQYTDHGPATPMNVHSIEVQAVTCNTAGTEGRIFGTATINGTGSFDFRIDVKDLGEPGSSDTYRIRISNGYDSGDRVLEGGNIQIH
jgi:hypothetical protein